MIPKIIEDGSPVRPEDFREPTDMELEEVGKRLSDFYKWRDYRSGSLRQFQGEDLESVLYTSRQLFWNALKTPSDDLKELGLEFSLPYVRNEVLNFVGRITSQNYKGRYSGDSLDVFGIKVLQGIYDKWRFKNNERVEKFWETLYGVVNGTSCRFIGYNDGKLTRRYLNRYDKKTGNYSMEEKDEKFWNDVWAEQVPIEDIYLPKIYERNIQKQGRLLWKTEMDWKDFKRDFRSYDNAEFVYPGNMIAEDSLYFRLLQGTGVLGGSKVQIFKFYDWNEDKYDIFANAVLLNPVGKGKRQTTSPLPWDHKMAPFTWGVWSPIDEKFAYGMPLPFILQNPDRVLNMTNVMLLEHEFRNISPVLLSSDIEAPKFTSGRYDMMMVNDINSFKELTLSEPSAAFFNMMAGIKGAMGEIAQGGGANMSPSKQPKSAREVLQLEQMKQAALGITLTMYYDVLRQEMLLVNKTALQFYPISKYEKQAGNIIRSLKVPNMSLTNGGVGDLMIRIVPKRDDKFDSDAKNLELYFESIASSMMNGKQMEIIEAPADVIQNLEFEITDIDMEPNQTDELRRATWVEQVLNPIINVYAPAGIADMGKTFLRHMEKFGEHPADFASEKVLPQLMSSWDNQFRVMMPPQQPQQVGGQAGMGAQTGNVTQSRTGMFGMNNTQPIPVNR